MPEAMKNLYELLKLCAPEEVYQSYLDKYNSGEQKFYGQLKADLAHHITALLTPIQERFNSPLCSPNSVKQLLMENAERVRPIARKNLRNMLEDLKFRDLAASYK